MDCTAHEAERLQALDRYSILDTAAERAFDDLVRLAALICETPISLVTLVDADRQWFKAKVGIDIDETSRQDSFCTHAIQGTGLFMVPDAQLDERFVDNRFVTGDSNIRFYAGMPLRTEDGHALGTLCVIDRVPRTLSDAQCRELEALARLAIGQLELRRQTNELTRSEQSLRISEERLSLAAEATADGIWDWNLVSGQTYLSPRCQQFITVGLRSPPGTTSGRHASIPTTAPRRFRRSRPTWTTARLTMSNIASGTNRRVSAGSGPGARQTGTKQVGRSGWSAP